MSRSRQAVLAAGLGAVALGLAMALVPGFGGSLGVGGILVLVVGYAALLFAAVVLVGRLRSDRNPTTVPDPGVVPAPPAPGDDVDERFAAAEREGLGAARTRHRLRRRLEELAVAAVAWRRGWDDATARERVAAGTWTDDPVAATYFRDGSIDLRAAGVAPVERLRLGLSSERKRAYAARRTAGAIADLVEEAPEPDVGSPDGHDGAAHSTPDREGGGSRRPRGPEGRA